MHRGVIDDYAAPQQTDGINALGLFRVAADVCRLPNSPGFIPPRPTIRQGMMQA
jgi:hypothetical protein